jgi:tetratricopeptide (TPR) repeat protein
MSSLKGDHVMKVYSVLLIIVLSFTTNVFSQVQSAAEPHYNLGLALYDKGDLDGAIREYREALRIQPDYAEAHNNLGNALEKKGDLDGAIREFREALRVQPDYADAHYNLGVALYDKGDLDGAIRESREALRIQPDDADAHFNLGNALYGKGDLDGAIREYREALRIQPDNARATLNLEWALREKRRRGQEAALVRAARTGQADSVRAFLEAGTDPNLRDADGWTALGLAAQEGHADVVRALLAAGAEVDDTLPGRGTALMAAAGHGRREVIRTLVEHGANVNWVASRPLTTPLGLAILSNQPEAIATLAELGADLNQQGADDVTPLAMAIDGGEPDVVATLVRHGADVQVPGPLGESAIEKAMGLGRADLLEVILDEAARRAGYDLRTMVPGIDDVPAGMRVEAEGFEYVEGGAWGYTRNLSVEQQPVQLGNSLVGVLFASVLLFGTPEEALREVLNFEHNAPHHFIAAQPVDPNIEMRPTAYRRVDGLGDLGGAWELRVAWYNVPGDGIWYTLARGRALVSLMAFGPRGLLAPEDVEQLVRLIDRRILEDAAAVLSEAERRRADAVMTLYHAEAMARSGMIAEALNGLERVQALDPSLPIEPSSWFLVCRYGALNDRANDVVHACETAVTGSGGHAAMRDARGIVRAMTGDLAGAMADFQAFLEWSPVASDRTVRLQWLERLAQRENPITPDALRGLGPPELYRALAPFLENEIDAAMPLFEQAASYNPTNADVLAWEADAARRSDKKERALNVARAALRIDSCHSRAHEVIAQVYRFEYGDSRPPEAADSAWIHGLQAVACDSTNGEAWFGLWRDALYYRDVDRETEALRHLVDSGFLTPGIVAVNEWLLRSAPESALVLVNGDLDTYPAVALQTLRGVRRDVAIVNTALLNLASYARLIRDRHGIPLPVTDAQLDTLQPYLDEQGLAVYRSTAIVRGWMRSHLAGALGRPLVASFTSGDPSRFGGPGMWRNLGPYRLHVSDSADPLPDRQSVRSYFEHLEAKDFLGPLTSPQDPSPVRRAADVVGVDRLLGAAALTVVPWGSWGEDGHYELLVWMERFARDGESFHWLHAVLAPLWNQREVDSAAVERLREGGRLARDGRIVEAVDAYREAREMDPRIMVSSEHLNTLCREGALWEHATEVLDACEEAVVLSPDDANIRDSRGVARALTGDLDGAIADLSFFVERTGDEDARAQRQAWINALETGQNPLTPKCWPPSGAAGRRWSACGRAAG